MAPLVDVITHDADAQTSGSASPVTWSHTVGTTFLERFLIVGIAIKGTGSGPSIDSVTYNSIAMTRAIAGQVSSGSDFVGVALYYLANPATGTNTVSVSFTATTPRVRVGSSSWYGIDQLNPLGQKDKTTGSSTQASIVIASAFDEMVLDAVGFYRGLVGFTISADAGQTEVFNGTGGAAPSVLGGGSYEPGSTATTMSWSTDGTSTDWVIASSAFVPARRARLLKLMGVGR